MGGHKCGSMRRDGCENAFLLEALAVGTATILGSFEAGAANLRRISIVPRESEYLVSTDLAPPTIATSNGGALPRCGLVLRIHVVRGRRTTMRVLRMSWVHIVGRMAIVIRGRWMLRGW